MIPPTNYIIEEPITQVEYRVIQQINDYRLEYGLGKVEPNQLTCKVARERLVEIQTDWSHNGFLKRKTYPVIWHENLGRYASESNIVEAWKNSPSHNKNLLRKVKNLCIKTENGYWVMEAK